MLKVSWRLGGGGGGGGEKKEEPFFFPQVLGRWVLVVGVGYSARGSRERNEVCDCGCL